MEMFGRVQTNVADTDGTIGTGKFNTGRLKHSFNLGAEYSDQETDRTQYIIDGFDLDGCCRRISLPMQLLLLQAQLYFCTVIVVHGRASAYEALWPLLYWK